MKADELLEIMNTKYRHVFTLKIWESVDKIDCIFYYK
jgi:hypothetical protein